MKRRSARDPFPVSGRNGRGVRWIYKRLLKEFGPQGWWPVTPVGGKIPVYSERWSRGKLGGSQQFEVAIGAILTQNTAWTNVEKALRGLIGEGVLSPQRLWAAPLPRLYRLVRSSGYFRQKARRLKNFCGFLLDRWNGRLDRFLDRAAAVVRKELLDLNGVGPETADSILLYAGRHPVFVVDAYTRRIGKRFGLFRGEDYPSVQNYFMSRLSPSIYEYRQYHALLVRLGKDFCRPKPLCGPCPLRARCRTGKKDVS